MLKSGQSGRNQQRRLQLKALILGGTKGLGREIAKICLKKGIEPIILGRSTFQAEKDPELKGASFAEFDLVKCNLDWLQHQVPDYRNSDYLFCVAGVGLKGSLVDQHWTDIRQVVETNFLGPMFFLSRFLRERVHPLNLVVVASTSSSATRHDEAVYGGTKAGQTQFARNIRWELPIGSSTLLFHPGGMRTEFWDGIEVDTEKFLDPAAVARIIWEKVELQKTRR